jgi:hypothetical protein
MSFIQDLYNNCQNISEKKGTLFSLVNYLIANDEISGIKKKDLEDRFALRQSYISILEQLKEKNVVTEEPTSVILNPEAKNYLKPILQNVLAKSYGQKYQNSDIDSDLISSDIDILSECRKELYS